MAIAAAAILAIGLSQLIDFTSGTNGPSTVENQPNENNGTTAGGSLAATNQNEFAVGHTGDVPKITEKELLLVIDLLVTDAGMINKAFDHALNRHGIRYDTEVKLTNDVQDKLLRSRFLEKGVEKVAEGQDPKKPVDLVLVVAKEAQFESLWIDLTTTPDEIRGFHLDMTILETDREIAEGLNEATRGRLALANLPEKILASYLGRAQRLTMKAALNSRRVENFFTSKSKASKLKPLDQSELNGLTDGQEDTNYRCLFVLHSLGD